MRYCKVVDGNITEYNRTRKDFGVGINSPESTCIAKGYYPIEDNKPSYNTETHRIAGSTYEVQDEKVVKSYEVVEIPLEEIINRKVENATKIVDGLIQAEITAYNEANGVMFASVDSLAKYVLVPTYTHYDFCKSMVEWVAVLWEAARTSTATTKEEFIAGLPTRI